MRKFRYEEGVDYYIKSIYRIPLLSQQEEKEILERMKNGDKQALSKLIQANLRFVINIAKRYSGYNISFLDLISAGNLGLMEAARRYDPSKGGKIYILRCMVDKAVHTSADKQSGGYHQKAG